MADHRLVGESLLSLVLLSHRDGTVDLSDLAKQRLLVYFYTGKPIIAPRDDPRKAPETDAGEGAMLRDGHLVLTSVSVQVLGISAQTVDIQREFAASERITHHLLSDRGLRLATLLGLRTCGEGRRGRYGPVVLITEAGKIIAVMDSDAPLANVRAALQRVGAG